MFVQFSVYPAVREHVGRHVYEAGRCSENQEQSCDNGEHSESLTDHDGGDYGLRDPQSPSGADLRTRHTVS